MVNNTSERLDTVFLALADPTRRAILERLARGEASGTELARPFSISVPAISKHLRVLEHAHLILRRKDGRTHLFRLAVGPMREAAAWIEPEALQSWFRPRGMSVIVSKLDARVGGSFRFDVEDGSTTIGTCLQIDPPEKLVFIWSGGAMQDKETVVTLDFLDLLQYPQSGPQNAESSVRPPSSLQPQGVYPTNPKRSSGFALGPATEVVLTHERLNTAELRAIYV